MWARLTLNTSDLVGGASHWSWWTHTSRECNSPTRAILDTYIRSGTRQASSTISEEDCVGRGHRTKLVATNRTSKRDAPEPFGFGEPKLFADGVGVKLGEAVSANSAPCRRWVSSCSSRGKDVDVALV